MIEESRTELTILWGDTVAGGVTACGNCQPARLGRGCVALLTLAFTWHMFAQCACPRTHSPTHPPTYARTHPRTYAPTHAHTHAPTLPTNTRTRTRTHARTHATIHARTHVYRQNGVRVGANDLHGRIAAQSGVHSCRNPITGWFKVPPAVPLSPEVPFGNRVYAGINPPLGPPRFV